MPWTLLGALPSQHIIGLRYALAMSSAVPFFISFRRLCFSVTSTRALADVKYVYLSYRVVSYRIVAASSHNDYCMARYEVPRCVTWSSTDISTRRHRRRVHHRLEALSHQKLRLRWNRSSCVYNTHLYSGY